MVSAKVAKPKYQINVNTTEHSAAKTLELNAIGVANITTDQPIPFSSYSENRTLGGFILIDKMSNTTVGCRPYTFCFASRAKYSLASTGYHPQSPCKNKKSKASCTVDDRSFRIGKVYNSECS